MDTVKVCNALGNKTRYNIVKSMKNKSISTCCNKIEYFENGVSVGDVVKLTGLAQSTVSQHLFVLEKAGILYKEKRDTWTCYFLNTKLLEEFLEELGRDLSPELSCGANDC
ncbi:MAG: ArsR/SmtB family transcription factor [Bacillota bacterium]